MIKVRKIKKRKQIKTPFRGNLIKYLRGGGEKLFQGIR
jgi:hypothetical protein